MVREAEIKAKCVICGEKADYHQRYSKYVTKKGLKFFILRRRFPDGTWLDPVMEWLIEQEKIGFDFMQYFSSIKWGGYDYCHRHASNQAVTFKDFYGYVAKKPGV